MNWTLGDKSVFLQVGSEFAFEALGSKTKSAVPYLILMWGRSGNDLTAINTLIGIGPAAVTVAVEELTNANGEMRLAAVDAVPWFGTNGAVAIPILLRLLDDKSELIRLGAYNALRVLTNRPDIVIPAVTSRLESKNPADVFWAATVLGTHGRLATSALPQLRHALDSVQNSTNVEFSSQRVRGSISNALQAIDPETYTNALKRGTDASSQPVTPPR